MDADFQKAQILQLLFAAVDEVNKMLPKSHQLEKSPDTAISGERSRLDSLGLINLIVAAEAQVEQRYGAGVGLAEDGALTEDDGPFRTLETLAEHIHVLLDKRPHA